ncbi:early nodulin-like protein 18 isoform X2 [Musa acuminata AAA Group]|uniref:early nodulin-like protein 18 isoform X2 n=1 Tax=Musa acuminata AAA Group TaxID=214697 RepID=UPI0031DEEA86
MHTRTTRLGTPWAGMTGSRCRRSTTRNGFQAKTSVLEISSVIFNTDKGHTVVQTYNVTTYKRCNYNDAETDDTIEWSAGAPKFSKEKVSIAVPLLKEGMTYFFSGNNDGRQCRHGQHFKINVTHGQGLPESLEHQAEAPAQVAPEKGGVVPGEAVPSVPSSFSNPVQAGSVEASSAAGESLARMLRNQQQRDWRFHLGLSLVGVLLVHG